MLLNWSIQSWTSSSNFLGNIGKFFSCCPSGRWATLEPFDSYLTFRVLQNDQMLKHVKTGNHSKWAVKIFSYKITYMYHNTVFFQYFQRVEQFSILLTHPYFLHGVSQIGPILKYIKTGCNHHKICTEFVQRFSFQ